MLSIAAIFVTLLAYVAARSIGRKWPRLQPLLPAIAIVWLIWWIFSGDWEAYRQGGVWISFWLGPATVALAVPLAKQMKQLAEIWRGVLLGTAAGCLISPLSSWLIMWLMGADDLMNRSMLSKSVTTPISVELTTMVGGIPALAGTFTAVTGMIGIAMARTVLKWAKVTDDWAIGIAVGTSSHAIGTAGLHQVSPVQTAASSVAMIIAGVITSLYL
ncbi:LrgB family protein, partial [Frankia sp. Cpl3]|nr:LrgB family protein [Frankia sp. Cpl3]